MALLQLLVFPIAYLKSDYAILFFYKHTQEKMMPQSVFITGNSSGLGYGLTQVYLENNARVYGLSRRGCEGLKGELKDERCDLSELLSIEETLTTLLSGVNGLDLIYLNAGILGHMNKLADLELDELNHAMDINVWANKIILDYLFANNIAVKQVIGISTGAIKSANLGWGSYSLSKIAFSKLIELYAKEFPKTHFTSLAPGLVDTAMQDYLCDENQVPVSEYPVVEKFRAARGTTSMPSAYDVALSISKLTQDLLNLESGSFADIRTL